MRRRLYALVLVIMVTAVLVIRKAVQTSPKHLISRVKGDAIFDESAPVAPGNNISFTY